jgi:hypothetical protein
MLADLKTDLLIGYRVSVVPSTVIKLQNLSNANILSVLNEAPHNEMEAHRRTHLTSALGGGVLSSPPVVSLPGQRAFVPTGWMDSGASLDVSENRQIS